MSTETDADTTEPDVIEVPAAPDAPDPLADDLAQLTALIEVIRANPGLPELLSRNFTATGLHLVPYLPTGPVAALGSWCTALPGRFTVRGRWIPEWELAEFVAVGKLADLPVTLTVTTWRATEGLSEIPSRVSVGALHKLADAESTGAPGAPAPRPALLTPIVDTIRDGEPAAAAPGGLFTPASG